PATLPSLRSHATVLELLPTPTGAGIVPPDSARSCRFDALEAEVVEQRLTQVQANRRFGFARQKLRHPSGGHIRVNLGKPGATSLTPREGVNTGGGGVGIGWWRGDRDAAPVTARALPDQYARRRPKQRPVLAVRMPPAGRSGQGHAGALPLRPTSP